MLAGACRSDFPSLLQPFLARLRASHVGKFQPAAAVVMAPVLRHPWKALAPPKLKTTAISHSSYMEVKLELDFMGAKVTWVRLSKTPFAQVLHNKTRPYTGIGRGVVPLCRPLLMDPLVLPALAKSLPRTKSLLMKCLQQYLFCRKNWKSWKTALFISGFAVCRGFVALYLQWSSRVIQHLSGQVCVTSVLCPGVLPWSIPCSLSPALHVCQIPEQR